MTLSFVGYWPSCQCRDLAFCILSSCCNFFPTDPQEWTDAHVREWVLWAVNEFTLKGVELQKFCISGAGLCALGKDRFLDLAPDFVGDILWEHLDILQKGEAAFCLY